MIAKSLIGAAVGVFKGLSVLIAACAVVAASAPADASSYVVTLQQDGPNVDASGFGTINLLPLSYSFTGNFGALMIPSHSEFLTGQAAADVYFGTMAGPGSFGSGGQTNADPVLGPVVGITKYPGFYGSLYVPAGYLSGDVLVSNAIYSNATYSSLGVTPGTYIWTWGPGADQSFTLEIGSTPTPLPAALPLFATGLGVMGLLGWRRKRKALAA